ncbi:glycosyltransferase family A protein [Deltaproteobacteria bacterium IMCC39524]|nr:glycosyltransferase family A protein [Deltaproteobacteria bacterium IMCC39524]
MDVSVVVPVLDDALGLRVTLESLLSQDFEKSRYEIIVVDNGSEDDTLSVARSFEEKNKSVVKVYSETEVKSSYASRNKGISSASGDILMFIDADMKVSPSYVTDVYGYYVKTGCEYIGARVKITGNARTFTEKYEQVHAFPVDEYLETFGFAPTCCLSVDRRLIEKIGFFDARLESGGDVEFGRRAKAVGATFGFIRRELLSHPARIEFSALKKKCERVNRGIAQLYYYYPKRFKMHYRGALNPGRYLPSSPLRLKGKASERGLSLNLCDLFVLSFYPTLFSLFAQRSLLREMKRLKLGERG